MQQSDIDFFLKFVPLVVGVIALIPALYNLAIGRYGHMRDEYKFAKEFLGDLNENPGMHVFAKQSTDLSRALFPLAKMQKILDRNSASRGRRSACEAVFVGGAAANEGLFDLH